MTLDDAQKQTVRQWIDDGMKVAEIQDKLVEAFDIKMTYMEVRFLVDDLGVIPKDPEPEQKPEDEPAAEDTASSPSPQQDQQQDMGELMDDGAPAPGGKVSISIDQIARPGMLVSGKVTFSDSQSASWYLDQMGQLGLAPEVEGYKPSQQDLMEFQMALQSELSRKGF